MDILEIGDQRLALDDRIVSLAELVRFYKAAVDLDAQADQARVVRNAWYDKFLPPPEDTEAWVSRVFDDRAIVHKDGKMFAYPYGTSDEGTITFGEPVEVALEYREVKGGSSVLDRVLSVGSRAVKALREEDGGIVVGGYLLLWGDPEHKDLQGDYFTPETDLWLEIYKSAPALFHHGLDDAVGLSVIGHRMKVARHIWSRRRTTGAF